MRKGYGPTDCSYHLPFTRFTAMVGRGLLIAQGFDNDKNIVTSEIPKTLSDESLKKIFDDADCVCYHGGVEMLIPKHLA